MTGSYLKVVIIKVKAKEIQVRGQLVKAKPIIIVNCDPVNSIGVKAKGLNVKIRVVKNAKVAVV